MTASGIPRSVLNGPPGTRRISRNVTTEIANKTSSIQRTRRIMYWPIAVFLQLRGRAPRGPRAAPCGHKAARSFVTCPAGLHAGDVPFLVILAADVAVGAFDTRSGDVIGDVVVDGG